MRYLWKSLAADSRLVRLGQLLVGALLLFHAWLLAKRLASGELFDSGIAWRWLGAAALLLFWGVQRRLARELSPRVRRRSHLAFWSLVLVLHVGVPAAPGEPALKALPLSDLGQLALPLFAAFLLLSGGALVASRQPALISCPARRAPDGSALRTGFLPQLSCRPPPRRR